MPNHVHAIVQFRMGAKLKTVSQSWMRYTVRRIDAATGTSGSFWQSEPFGHIIRSPAQCEYLPDYVAENPTFAYGDSLSPENHIEERDCEQNTSMDPKESPVV